MGAIKIKEPLYEGQKHLEEIVMFLEREGPAHMTKEQRRWLARKAVRYRLINDELYCKGKDLVLRRVPYFYEIENILP